MAEKQKLSTQRVPTKGAGARLIHCLLEKIIEHLLNNQKKWQFSQKVF